MNKVSSSQIDVGNKFKLLMRIGLFLALISIGLGAIWWIADPWPKDCSLAAGKNSTLIYDRSGRLLREVYLSGGGSGRWVALEKVPQWVQEAVLTAEDRRFYHHCGVDPLAVGRSAFINLKAGRVVMGGSTISEQLTRMLMPSRPRNLKTKFIELSYSLRLSFHFSKKQILEAYLNRAYFGGQVYGIEAAAQRYFGRSVQTLSPAQGAFLAVLLRAPKELSADSGFETAIKLQRRLLQDMKECGALSEVDLRSALAEKIELSPFSERFAAPHFCDYIVAQLPEGELRLLTRLDTSLDLELQQYAERVLNYHLGCLTASNVSNGSVIVLDVPSGEILAMVGSRNYFESSAGQNNGCLTRRQPGSSLKPFTYAASLQNGFTAASILPDVPYLDSLLKDSFVPENYDRLFHGPVRLRRALACSYNIPAVYVLQKIGINSLLDLLHKVGLTELNKGASYYGLGLTLGGGEVSLLNLTNAYRTLARGGLYSPTTFYKTNCQLDGRTIEPKDCAVRNSSEQRVISADVCAVITDILADNSARAEAFGSRGPLNMPFYCAVKTGTSKGYRDNWCVGYNGRFVVGVWTGNFNSSPMLGVSGATGAAPIFRDIMKYVNYRGHKDSKAAISLRTGRSVDSVNSVKDNWSHYQELQKLSKESVCADSGEVPGSYCFRKIEEYFLHGSVPKEKCKVHKLYCFDKKTDKPICPLNCNSSDYYTKVIAVYPYMYRAWMRENGLEVPPEWAEYRDKSAKHTPVQRRSAQRGDSQELPRYTIIYPEDGAVFHIDPFLRRNYQKINFKALGDSGNEELVWKIDGRFWKSSLPPHVVGWPLQKGIHKVSLHKNKQGQACHTITIAVEE
ncbi:MAG: penicillin-binding protein 1C [Candidatus Bruticola sp.]